MKDGKKLEIHNVFATFLVLTVAARQGVAPLVIFLTHNWLLVTQCVPWVARERHPGAGGEAAATAAAVDWDTRIEARVRLHFHAYKSGSSDGGRITATSKQTSQLNISSESMQKDLLSYLILKPAAERLLSVVNSRKSTLEVEIRK